MFSEFLMFCWLISQAFRRVKSQQNMRNEGNICHIVRDKRVITTIIFIVFWDLMIFNKFSSQVKWSAIIGNKHGIYELLHEFPNNLKLFENLKTSYNYNLAPRLSSKSKILLMLAKNCWKIEIKTLPHLPTLSMTVAYSHHEKYCPMLIHHSLREKAQQQLSFSMWPLNPISNY